MASILSLDVAGAFDHVLGISEYMVKWTESFLENRSTSITIENRTSKIFAIDTGIPQGSPISSNLFLFFNASLIKDCTNLGLKV